MKNIIESQFTVADHTDIKAKITDLETAFAGKTGQLDANVVKALETVVNTRETREKRKEEREK